MRPKMTLRTILAFLRPALDLGGIGDIVSGGLGISQGQHLPQAGFTPGAAVEMDQKWYAAMQAINSAIDRNTGMVDPTLLHAYSQMLGIDLAPIVQATGMAGGMYTGMAGRSGAAGDVMGGQANAAFGRGADIWRTAADPENALHDYLQQQVVDTTRAGDSARGVAMSPYSAGNESDAVRKFNMDWSNNMLGRQVTGAGAANQATATGAGALDTSMGYYGMQPGFTVQGASLPIQGQQFAASAPIDYTNQFTQAEGFNVIDPYSRIQQNINPYLGLAANTDATNYRTTLARANMSYDMTQGGVSDLFSGANSLFKGFAMPGMGGGASVPGYGGGAGP